MKQFAYIQYSFFMASSTDKAFSISHNQVLFFVRGSGDNNLIFPSFLYKESVFHFQKMEDNIGSMNIYYSDTHKKGGQNAAKTHDVKNGFSVKMPRKTAKILSSSIIARRVSRIGLLHLIIFTHRTTSNSSRILLR